MLVLDEATSHLDLGTHLRVHANLATLGTTQIVISHRLDAVSDADTIYVLEGGAVVEHGTYDELKGRGTSFSTIFHPKEQVPA